MNKREVAKTKAPQQKPRPDIESRLLQYGYMLMPRHSSDEIRISWSDLGQE